MRISDWSSDVCSSDLQRSLCLRCGRGLIAKRERWSARHLDRGETGKAALPCLQAPDILKIGLRLVIGRSRQRATTKSALHLFAGEGAGGAGQGDRKGVGEGRSVDERGVLGGGRSSKK